MGISGLLPVLKSITETKTIDQYRGQTLAIDGYCWLHRAIYSCSQEICLGEDTTKYIVYFIDRVQALLQNGITPYVVFDGGPLPMKKGTEEERRKSRAKNRELGLASLRQKNYAEARKHFVRAADVTPYMAHRVIRQLRLLNVQYVVAPYEADAQLAFLVKSGRVDGVITEDSDCLPFGCEKVLFKMDRDGVAQEIQTKNLKRNDALSFHMFTHEMFLEMCIFSGCDYLPSLPGFGLKKAYALVKQHGTYTKILRALRMEGKVRIPQTYEAEFERALLTFRHQRVYDPASKQLVPLTPIPEDVLDKHSAMDFLGPLISHETAQAIAEGDVDPITSTPFTDPPPSRPQSVHTGRPPFQIKKTDCSGFIHRKSPMKNKSPSKIKSSNRNLPAWMARKASQSNASTPSPPSAAPVPSVASTPQTISHFFAATRQIKLSPTNDTTKTSTLEPTVSLLHEPSIESSVYESQESSDVDVARSISFSPLNDDVKQMSAKDDSTSSSAPADKENAVPSEPKTTTENAFARLMRAGSTLQKHSLKRKTPSGSNAFMKRLSCGVVRRETAMERIKQLAFSSQSTSDRCGPLSQQSTPVVCSAQAAEPDSEPFAEASQCESASQPCVVQSAVLRERLAGKQLTDEGGENKPKPVRSSARGDAFARFRFVAAKK